MKPWWQYLLEVLAGLFTKEQLGRAGAGPDMLQGAVTGQVDLPTLYTAPQPPAGVAESRDLAHCHPELARRYGLVIAEFFERTGRQMFPTRTWCSDAGQFEHFKKGRHQDALGEWVPDDPIGRAGIVTNLDGIHEKGRHNVYPAEAVDSAVDVDPGPGKHVSWDPRAYDLLGELADKHGLVWGGRFHGYGPNGDYPHLELPAGVA